MKEMRILVAHPFQQHSFHTASAVKKQGIYMKYVTSIYLKKGTLTYTLRNLLRGENAVRANGRRTDELADSDVDVLAEIPSLALLIFQRINKKIYYKWYWKTIEIFNYKLMHYIGKFRPDCIILYDTVSGMLVKRVKERFPEIKIIIDMSAPTPMYMKEKYKEEYRKHPLYAETDILEIEGDYYNKKIQYNLIECKYADAFLVASDFTKSSLTQYGVDENRIYKCIYGLDQIEYSPHVNENKKIVCSFCGRVCLQKGAYRLFDAIRDLDLKEYEFHFYGNYDMDSQYYKDFKDYVTFHGHIPHDQMINELSRSNVLIFPSIADGFGFSVTEAISTGNHVICSTNAGVSDLLIKHNIGDVYSADDNQSLVTFLKELRHNRGCLDKLKKNPKNELSEYTWSCYSESLLSAIEAVNNSREY